jgi:hypothetical protein
MTDELLKGQRVETRTSGRPKLISHGKPVPEDGHSKTKGTARAVPPQNPKSGAY